MCWKTTRSVGKGLEMWENLGKGETEEIGFLKVKKY